MHSSLDVASTGHERLAGSYLPPSANVGASSAIAIVINQDPIDHRFGQPGQARARRDMHVSRFA